MFMSRDDNHVKLLMYEFMNMIHFYDLMIDSLKKFKAQII